MEEIKKRFETLSAEVDLNVDLLEKQLKELDELAQKAEKKQFNHISCSNYELKNEIGDFIKSLKRKLTTIQND